MTIGARRGYRAGASIDFTCSTTERIFALAAASSWPATR